MRISTFASGSSGNCTLVSTGSTHILIDAGISMRRIAANLTCTGLKPADIAGVLVTHEHKDHINGIATMTKYHKIPLYAPPGVAACLARVPGAEQCIKQITPGEAFCIDDAEIRAFHTPHDVPESVGYSILADQKFGFCTDLGHVTEEVARGLEGSDIVMIEANHDLSMLRQGRYPYFLKQRILSDHGHLSNPDSGKLALWLAKHGTRAVILGHLSQENNLPTVALQTVSEVLQHGGCEPGKDLSLSLAPAAERHTLIAEGDTICLV
ncbi:MAG: MBL fold metallo-hydrolase [Oscillospiraceae bacterium]|jgi:phosphoribosyl 1,2-cyclic phosphodiesterase